VGVPLGLLLSRTNVRGRRLAFLLHVFPMLLPPLLLTLGWFHLFGREGLLGSEKSASLLFGEVGVVAVLALTFAPIATTLTALGVWHVDASLEEAARAVAGPARVAFRILLPVAMPAVALAGILIFSLSMSELGVPMFLRVETYPAAIFARLGGASYAPGEAFSLALPLLPIALLLVIAERRLAGGRSFAVLGLRGATREPLRLGRLQHAGTLGAWLFVVLSLAPILSLAFRAGTGGGFARVGDWIGGSLGVSLVASAAGATGVLALGAVLGHALSRRRPGAGLLDAVAVFAFVIPAAILGVGLIAVWNHEATHAVYGSVAILVVGFVARYSVIGIRTAATLFSQSPRELEEAATAAGASFLRRFSRILLPVHARGLVAAWFLALVFCLRDLETAVLFYPPGGEPLTVRIFTLEPNGPEEVVSALAVVHVMATAGVLALGWIFVGRGARR
jgi:iron(III) transport system permease protein